jgi:hypothetical protein
LDLNQWKAGMVESLDAATCSAIHDRLQAWRAREAEASIKKFREDSLEGQAIFVTDVEQLLSDCFLSPIGTAGPLLLVGAAPGTSLPSRITTANSAILETPPLGQHSAQIQSTVPSEKTKPSSEIDRVEESQAADKATPTNSQSTTVEKPTRKIHTRLQPRRRRRASDNIVLAMPWEQYLRIVQLTASVLTGEAARPPPPELESLLESAGIKPACWPGVIEHFAEWFHCSVGRVDHLTALTRLGRKWIQGIRACRRAFG